jgi:hypothetical protein
MEGPQLPSITDPPEAHADWLELMSLTSSDRFVSWTDHQRDLRISGPEESDGTPLEELESTIDTIIMEVSERREACGNRNETYPFEITEVGLRCLPEAITSVYVFQLLLSLFGRSAGPAGSYGDRIFEDLSAAALRSYLGKAQEGLEARVFGFPRRIGASSFREAVDELCRAIGEGVKCKDAPEIDDQKDAHLDIVAWRRFPGSSPGHMIAFGQCATGTHWFQKIHELRPKEWCQLWLLESPLVPPVATFFLPRRVERLEWRRASVYGGIIFDRCRISWLLPEIPESLVNEILSWTRHVLTVEATR